LIIVICIWVDDVMIMDVGVVVFVDFIVWLFVGVFVVDCGVVDGYWCDWVDIVELGWLIALVRVMLIVDVQYVLCIVMVY